MGKFMKPKMVLVGEGTKMDGEGKEAEDISRQ